MSVSQKKHKKAKQKTASDINWINERLKQIVKLIEEKQYQQVPIQSLKRALLLKAVTPSTTHEIPNLVMRDIRHDLKNALRSILLYLDDLGEQMGKENLDRLSLSELVSKLIKTHQKLLAINHRLYDISFLQIEPYFETIDVKSFIERILTQLELTGDTEVEIKLECDELSVDTDPTLLGTVLRQLIENAIESLRDGGSIRIAVKLSVEQQKMNIGIEDNGHGIPEDLLTEIFKPEVSSKEGHSGMGLPLVQLAVSAVGGEIAIVSQEGVGTIVEVSIPTENSNHLL